MTWENRAGLVEALQSGEAGHGALWFTTNPGLEDVVADELSERLQAASLDVGTFAVERNPLGFSGNMIALLPRLDAAIVQIACGLRSVHDVIRPLYGFALSTASPDALDEIATRLSARGIDALETAAVSSSFRVTTQRSGEHAFTSVDVQRRAGAALVQRYGLRVNLQEPDCEVRIDVVDQRCLVGVQLTPEPVSRRRLRKYNPRGAVKANVAYAMIRFAGVSSGRMLDPFCGSATIPLEAAQVHPDLDIAASDYSARAVAGARQNVEAIDLQQRIDVCCRNFIDLDQHHGEGSFDAIITNPPFGVHIGRGMDFQSFYSRFLEVAAYLLKPGGRLVFLAWKRGVIDRANRLHGHFLRRHVRVVETGGIFPRIYVMERRAETEPLTP